MLVVCIDVQNYERYSALSVYRAMGVNAQALVFRDPGIEHDIAHGALPEQSRPVIWPGLERVLIQKAIIA